MIFKSRVVKPTTYYGLKKKLDKNILEFFKKYKLNAIKLNVIVEWMSWLDKKGTTKKHQNLIIGYLKEILTYAKDNYEFESKVITKIQKYRIDEVEDKKIVAEWNFWTFEEFNKFIGYVDDPLYKLIFTFLYYTGLRLGEMIALTWNDLDFNRKTVNINKSFTNKLGDGQQHILSPKTKNSIRIIDLDNDLIILLKQHYKEEKNIYHFNKNMFLFGNVTPITPTTFSRRLDKYITLANVKKITPHGFRHSHVSLLIDLGCDSRDVAKRVGDTVQIVESTYYHMFPNKKSNTVNALNNLNKNQKNTR